MPRASVAGIGGFSHFWQQKRRKKMQVAAAFSTSNSENRAALSEKLSDNGF
jgi:hypothetical protein